jgi:hypothetical protein
VHHVVLLSMHVVCKKLVCCVQLCLLPRTCSCVGVCRRCGVRVLIVATGGHDTVGLKTDCGLCMCVCLQSDCGCTFRVLKDVRMHKQQPAAAPVGLTPD